MVRTVSKLLEFSWNPSLIHDVAAIRVIAYLYQIKNLAIKYLKETLKNYIFIRASNAAFSNNLVNRKNIKGYLFTLFRGLINWQLTKQKSVTKSSTEAKLLALLHTATKLI